MAFDFNPKTFRSVLDSALDDHLEALTTVPAAEPFDKLLAAMRQAIDVMQRADADTAATGEARVLQSDEISEIGDYTLNLLGEITTRLEKVTSRDNRDLIRLAVPVALWIGRHGGHIRQLELAVNSLASFANEISDTVQLAELTRVIHEIIDYTADEIIQDLEQTNPMRPWRILNLNYGIVATRSHDTVLMEQAYDVLVKNLPHDARQFFREGMQQMDIVGYPPEVRAVVEKYDSMWGSDSTLH
jgi:hypothetical protein